MKISYKFEAKDEKAGGKDIEFELELCIDVEDPIVNVRVDGKEILWLGNDEVENLIKALEDIKEKMRSYF